MQSINEEVLLRSDNTTSPPAAQAPTPATSQAPSSHYNANQHRVRLTRRDRNRRHYRHHQSNSYHSNRSSSRHHSSSYHPYPQYQRAITHHESRPRDRSDERTTYSQRSISDCSNNANQTVFLILPSENIVALYPVTKTVDNNKTTCHPFVPAYASTICKVQGQNLGKIILWLDSPCIPRGSAYVALPTLRYEDGTF
ncbi:hypothetical protein P5673_011719 [Acropora cervicornis]|uniref:Uncharacterized protein n=1 Tax=Acropora cervicornis TaxID=6130 RepID=A0AAD9QPM1_ACRCE|nr:hypothetical protein P5673_011719 [Acropora cervicornis]